MAKVTPVKLSIVFPCYNESNNFLLWKALENYKNLEGIEIIAVDGNSTDNTVERLKQYCDNVISTTERARGKRMDIGWRQAKADVVLFHHPRSIVATEGIKHLAAQQQKLEWGGFRHKFDNKHWLLDVTSKYSNDIRARYGNVLYLDHCIFAHKELLKCIQSVPHNSIFEDTLLSYRLRALSKAQLLPYSSTTSAIRYAKGGIYKRWFYNQLVKLAFYLNINPNKINRFYEKEFDLN